MNTLFKSKLTLRNQNKTVVGRFEILVFCLFIGDIETIRNFNYLYRKRKGGGCLFHGGLAHNCDYKDLVGAVDETDHWGSDMSPGKVIHVFQQA